MKKVVWFMSHNVWEELKWFIIFIIVMAATEGTLLYSMVSENMENPFKEYNDVLNESGVTVMIMIFFGIILAMLYCMHFAKAKRNRLSLVMPKARMAHYIACIGSSAIIIIAYFCFQLLFLWACCKPVMKEIEFQAQGKLEAMLDDGKLQLENMRSAKTSRIEIENTENVLDEADTWNIKEQYNHYSSRSFLYAIEDNPIFMIIVPGSMAQFLLQIWMVLAFAILVSPQPTARWFGTQIQLIVLIASLLILALKVVRDYENAYIPTSLSSVIDEYGSVKMTLSVVIILIGLASYVVQMWLLQGRKVKVSSVVSDKETCKISSDVKLEEKSMKETGAKGGDLDEA